ncbi:MAG: Uma2 family endonuclease, partial [Hyphomicrobiaceae bacterium]
SQDIAIRIPCGYIRRPDVSVDCTPGGPRGPTATKPRMILEVLSPSTLTFDRFRKLEEYKTVPSVAVILLVDTQAPQVAIHRRRGELWQVEVLENPAGTIDLPEIGAVLPMAELYEGIEFDKK